MMRRVPLEKLLPGSRLAETVHDAFGNMLLAKNRVLDAHLISLLCNNKITDVTIVIERTPAEQAAFASALKACLDRRFERVSGHPLMDSLKQMIYEYRCGEQQ